MKVIAINGSPRLIGNTSNILGDIGGEFEKEGIEFEHVHLYSYDVDPCNDCRSCEMRGDGRCIMEDSFNDLADELRQADGILLASPAYYGSCTSQMKLFMERVGLPMETGNMGLARKVGGALVVRAHAGASIVVGASPAPEIRALNSPQYTDDKAGMKGITGMAKEMAWLIQRLNGL